jgi:hypothetical protein
MHQSSTPPDVPSASNLVIANSTINVIGRNQHNHYSHSGPIPGSNVRVSGTPAVVKLSARLSFGLQSLSDFPSTSGYYTATGNPAPYLTAYGGHVYGVLTSPVLLSPVISTSVSGQPVVPSSSSHGNQVQHQVSPLINSSAS